MRYFFLTILILFLYIPAALNQQVYQHVSNFGIYQFLDELANSGLIELNTTVKPYSRMLIARKLQEAERHTDELNKRQKQELEFYLKDYNKELQPGRNFKKRIDLFYYKDSLFTLSVNPVLGIRYFHNQHGNMYHRWNGAEAFAYIGSHIGIYASLRDNHESEIIAAPGYLSPERGGAYKYPKGGGVDFSEMRGGLTYTWKWGSVGLIKDHNEWGDNYAGPGILSSKSPSYAQIKLNVKPVKWFEFNYFHGWLVSGVIDSTRSYRYTNGYASDTRLVYANKYLAANMFTFKPVSGILLSTGNSVVYSGPNIHPVYLIPFLYFGPDKDLNSTENTSDFVKNSQLFFDVSIRKIKNIHLYASLFADEMVISRFFKKNEYNPLSYKYGVQFSNVMPNTFVTLEYTRSNPFVYQSKDPVTSYKTNAYNLGHFLNDNSQEFYASLALRLFRASEITLAYRQAKHGPADSGTEIFQPAEPFMKTVVWENRELSISANWQFINDAYLYFSYMIRKNSGDEKSYTAPYYYGKTNTVEVGVNYGF